MGAWGHQLSRGRVEMFPCVSPSPRCGLDLAQVPETSSVTAPGSSPGHVTSLALQKAAQGNTEERWVRVGAPHSCPLQPAGRPGVQLLWPEFSAGNTSRFSRVTDVGGWDPRRDITGRLSEVSPWGSVLLWLENMPSLCQVPGVALRTAYGARAGDCLE